MPVAAAFGRRNPARYESNYSIPPIIPHSGLANTPFFSSLLVLDTAEESEIAASSLPFRDQGAINDIAVEYRCSFSDHDQSRLFFLLGSNRNIIKDVGASEIVSERQLVRWYRFALLKRNFEIVPY